MLDNNQYSKNALLGPAQQLAAAGLSVIPVDAHKRPTEPWKAFQTRAADTGAIVHWFTANGQPAAPALAVICGAISGQLTVLDFDTDADGCTMQEPFEALVEARAPGLLSRLPHVRTPSGGLHIYLRAERCEGNQKLAMGADGAVRIETRGEGGYVVAPPSPGYRTMQGTLRAITKVTEGEYRVLFQCARALSETPAEPPKPIHMAAHQLHGDRPGDAYNARATLHEVADLLCRHGWTAGAAHGDKIPMIRPGKSPRDGISGDVTFVQGIPVFTQFSSNGGPFEPQRGYSAFAVYAILENGGDYAAAARGLGGTAYPAIAPTAPVSAQQHQTPRAEEPGWDWRTAGKTLPQIWAMEFAEPRWFVEGMIPAGTTFFFGGPKTGKSLLGWQIALAAAAGGLLFGKMHLAARPVVYVCMEDGLRLVKQRTMRMMEGINPPANLVVYEYWRPLLEGGIDDLRAYLAEHPGTDFIIDTFENVRARERGGNAYREDYGGVKPLTALAHECDCNVLIVHHEAKADRNDAMMTMSGSLGLGAAVDTQVKVSRNRFVEGIVKLQITSRGAAVDLEMALQYDPATYIHTLLGEAEQVVQTRERAAIVDVLVAAGEALGLQALCDRLGKRNLDSVRRTCDRMVEEHQLARPRKGEYAAMAGVVSPSSDTQLDNKSDSRTVGQQDPTDTNIKEPSSPTSLAVRLSDSGGCPGCGWHYSARTAPYDDEMAICIHCGIELGRWMS